jgi:putative alpha-1,2-mannosidase
MFELAQTDWDMIGDRGTALTSPRPYYWAGNEPDIDAPFVLAQLGRRDLAAHWLRWIVDTMYTDGVDGVPGNDDGGTMGSWYVLASLGLYPVAGSDAWIVVAPRFPRARVVVGGNELVIEAVGDGEYVRSISLDGVPIDATTITHAQLATASSLRFEMAATP